MVLYDVGKKTHKNCVSGPLFACRVSPRHAFSGNNCRHHHVGPTFTAKVFMSSAFTRKTVAYTDLAGLKKSLTLSTGSSSCQRDARGIIVQSRE